MRFFKGLFGFFLFGLISACQTGVAPAPPFDWQGHRGARGEAPENTVSAMLRALQDGVRSLEMDVVISADSVVLLSHEPFFNPQICLDSSGAELPERGLEPYNLYRLSFASIQKFDCGSKGHPDFPGQESYFAAKPSLLELISRAEEASLTMNRPAPFYNIEIKSRPEWDGLYHPKVSQYVDLVMAVIKQAGISERSLIQSFDMRALRELHQRYPQQRLALLVEEEDPRQPAALLADLGFQPEVYSPHFRRLTAAKVSDLRTQKMQVIPWTVNEIEEAQKLMEWGVDGIISDYPARLISALGRSSNAQIE